MVNNLLGVRALIRSDTEIMSNIVFLFQTDTVLQGRDLGVQSVEGMVTLRGNVSEFHAKVHAAEVAGRVRGVRGVKNTIEVQIAAQFRDSSIADRIRTRLKSNAELRWVVNRIEIDVSGGVVTLSGDVGRLIERREAARMALLTGGVLRVVNMLTVNHVNYPWERLNRDTAPLQDQLSLIHI